VAARRKTNYDARLDFYRRTGRFPKAKGSAPWLQEEERLLAKHSTRELMRRLGRTWEAIKSHRRELKIRLRPTNTPWKAAELKLLGTGKDAAVAKRLSRSVSAVKSKRLALRIPGFRPRQT
jgi:hypothetical protein